MSIKKNRICMRATRTELRGRNILESLLFLSVDKADTKRGEAKENERAREKEREYIVFPRQRQLFMTINI